MRLGGTGGASCFSLKILAGSVGGTFDPVAGTGGALTGVWGWGPGEDGGGTWAWGSGACGCVTYGGGGVG